jgi:hypothetical protein
MACSVLITMFILAVLLIAAFLLGPDAPFGAEAVMWRDYPPPRELIAGTLVGLLFIIGWIVALRRWLR